MLFAWVCVGLLSGHWRFSLSNLGWARIQRLCIFLVNLVLQGHNLHVFGRCWFLRAVGVPHLNLLDGSHQLHVVQRLYWSVGNRLGCSLVVRCWCWSLFENDQRTLRDVSASVTFATCFGWGVLWACISICCLLWWLSDHTNLTKVVVQVWTFAGLYYLDAFLELGGSSRRSSRVFGRAAHQCWGWMTATDSTFLIVDANEIIDSDDLNLRRWVTFIRIQNFAVTAVKRLINKLLMLL